MTPLPRTVARQFLQLSSSLKTSLLLAYRLSARGEGPDPAGRSPARRSPARRSPARRSLARQSPARRSPARRSPARRSPAASRGGAEPSQDARKGVSLDARVHEANIISDIWSECGRALPTLNPQGRRVAPPCRHSQLLLRLQGRHLLDDHVDPAAHRVDLCLRSKASY